MKDRKNKPWRGTLQYKNSQGEWKQKTKIFSGVQYKRDAQVALNAWREEMERQAQEEQGREIPAKTVADAVRECLNTQRDLNRLSTGSYQKQMQRLESNIEPYFVDKDFYRVTRAEVSEYVRLLSVKFKPQSVRTIYAILAKTYKEAQRNGEIINNPCSFVKLPQVDQHHINYLDEEGRRKFLTVIDALDRSDWRYIAGMLAYYTGMRASEICALQWQDINFATKTIRVERAASSVKDENKRVVVEIKQPKSKAGRRTIPLVSQVEKALRDYLGGSAPKAKETVLDKKHLNPSNACACFLAWTKANGIIGTQGKPLTLHGLRHTFATVSVQANVDIKSLASILGHARADMTLNVYASDDERAKRVAMDAAERFYQKEEGSDF